MTGWHRSAALAVVGLGLGTLACSSGSGLPEPEDVAVNDEEAPAQPAPERRRPDVGLEPLPLAVGHHWRWRVSERKGAGPRIFGFATKKPEHTVLADWTLEITGEEGGKFDALFKRMPAGEELPSQTPMTLWAQDGIVWMNAGKGDQPALEIALPPDPVSAEQVRCVAHVLGGVVGRCAARPGGAMGALPGLEEGVVAEHLKPGAEVGQFLVGLMSVGMFIPGNQSAVQTATRVEFTPGPGTEADFAAHPGPVLAHVQGRGIEALNGLDRALEEHGIDAEQGAAVVARITPTDRLKAARLVLDALPEDQRYPVVRTALALVPGEGPLNTLAKLRDALPATTPDAHREALLGLFEAEADRTSAGWVLDGDRPVFTEVLATTDGPFDRDRIEALDAALPGKHPTLDDAVATASLLQFDDGRREAIDRLVRTFPEPEQAEALAALVQVLAFDDGRLALYRDHAEALQGLSVAQREALVGQVAFREDEAREILGLPAEP